MNKGTIKWYDAIKGYGFIQPDDGGEDIFVHISEVEKAGYTNLGNDQAIKYELQTKHGKSSATDLQLI